ncbi:MAG: hypothetical protein ACLFSQ_11275 [Candidatus Zixiibacteriota bacterium]
MKFRYFVFSMIFAVSLFAIKVGTDGENIYLRGDKTGVGVDVLPPKSQAQLS